MYDVLYDIYWNSAVGHMLQINYELLHTSKNNNKNGTSGDIRVQLILGHQNNQIILSLSNIL